MAASHNGLRGLKVALVGGAGFIGHHLALSLARKGAEVSIIDNLQGSSPEGSHRRHHLPIVLDRLASLDRAGVKLYIQDARDYMALGPLLNRTIAPQVVVNLATRAQGKPSREDPHGNFEHSLRTLENVLDSSRGRPRHFIYLSTHRVYGNHPHQEVEEDTPLDPLGIDGAVKFTGEKMVIAYQQVFDLEYTIVRTSTVYGPRHMARRLGQISIIDDHPTGWRLEIAGGPEDVVDFTYVEDLVEGLALVITKPEARNQVFNLTSAQPRRIREFVAVLQGLLPGSQATYQPPDAALNCQGSLSIAKARKLLGFTPRFDLEEGMARWIQWYRDRVSEELA